MSFLDPRRPLGRLPYLLIGVALMGVKYAVDRAVAQHFGEVFLPHYYVSPPDAPLLHPAGRESYWLALWAAALPFLAIGVLLTMRRLTDAGLSRRLALLFFIPFGNLLLVAALVAIPPRAEPAPSELTEGLEDPPTLPPAPAPALGAHVSPLSPMSAPPGEPSAGRIVGAIFGGGAIGGLVALAGMGVAVYGLGEYGAALFLGAPVIAGFTSAVMYMRMDRVGLGGSIAAACVGLMLVCGVLVVLALEGALCLLMAMPLATISAILGAWVAWLLAFTITGGAEHVPVVPAVIVLPLLFGVEATTPRPDEALQPVRTVVIVDAPPDVVFRHVIAFDPLPEPRHWLFRAGVAAPLGATIEGEGVGAVRHCRFTTGAFIEPITVWEPCRELAFGVTAQPEPMEELTLWPGPAPPHLHGYLDVDRGQFLLEPLPGGKTRLIGTTWYRVKVFPRDYWRAWSDYVIHKIHERVLRHVAERAEADARGR